MFTLSLRPQKKTTHGLPNGTRDLHRGEPLELGPATRFPRKGRYNFKLSRGQKQKFLQTQIANDQKIAFDHLIICNISNDTPLALMKVFRTCSDAYRHRCRYQKTSIISIMHIHTIPCIFVENHTNISYL